MPTALTNEVREYILEEERNLTEDKRTIFLIRPLIGLDYCAVMDMAEIDRELLVKKEGRVIATNINRLQYETLKRGLTGWKNFRYQSGADCPFVSDVEENLKRIDPQYWPELYIAIRELTDLDEETGKNSNLPPNGSHSKTGKISKKSKK